MNLKSKFKMLIQGVNAEKSQKLDKFGDYFPLIKRKRKIHYFQIDTRQLQ